MKKENAEAIAKLLQLVPSSDVEKELEGVEQLIHRRVLSGRKDPLTVGFSSQETKLLRKYYDNVNVLVIRWHNLSGGLTDFHGILSELKEECARYGIRHKEIKTDDSWFYDLRRAVYLRDNNTNGSIGDCLYVKKYISVITASFYQKYMIVPLMKEKAP
jgi:hypothetical protein